MCLRRVINPDIDADTLLFNAYEDLHRFFENDSDKVDNIITVDDLVKNVNWSLSKSIEEIEESFSDNLKYLRSNRPKLIYKFPKNTTRAQKNMLMKEVNWSVIKDYYDTTKSVKENLQILNGLGIKVKKSTLYNYCKENNISYNLDEDILREYDNSLSLRKNLELLKNKGYKISLGKLSNLISSVDVNTSTTYYSEMEKMNTSDENNEHLMENDTTLEEVLYDDNSWAKVNTNKDKYNEPDWNINYDNFTIDFPDFQIAI